MYVSQMAKLSLALSFGISLDRSRICADRIARFRFSILVSCVGLCCVYVLILITYARSDSLTSLLSVVNVKSFTLCFLPRTLRSLW